MKISLSYGAPHAFLQGTVSVSLLLDALSINLSTMTDLHNANNQLNFRYGIDDTIGALAYSILIIMTGEFIATARTRIGR